MDGKRERTLATTIAAARSADGPTHRAARAVRVSLQSDSVDDGSVVGYSSRLLDRNGRDLIVVHRHPVPIVPAPSFPHLHVLARLLSPDPTGALDPAPLDKLHLPTGHGALPAVVRRPIKGFGVRPLTPTWQARLTEVESVVEAGAIDG